MSTQDDTLPDNISALKRWHQAALNKPWSEEWKRSPRYARAKVVDPKYAFKQIPQVHLPPPEATNQHPHPTPNPTRSP
ncbi:hypothetical protein M405DRAFT_827866 [Rhizopogon salebrosus TDB-379]|nr:hypothetical protein M405DRAFT_827866 [Rhizopogon salebrosus TDB-379]